MKARSILLLTRDPALRALVRAGAGGATVTVREEIDEVITRLRTRPDLVVLDFPEGCHGMTLLAAVQSCGAGIPVIAVTARDRYHAAGLAYAEGAAACLARPFRADEFAAVVERLGAAKPLLAAA